MIRTSGRLALTQTASFAQSLAGTVKDAEVVVTALPTFAMREVLGTLSPLVVPGQVILIAPAASAGPLLLARDLEARGIRTPIAGLAATVLTCRVQADGTALIGALRSKIGFACAHADDTQRVLNLCEGLFGTSFTVLDDVLALALAYVIPVVHGPLMLCNLSRIEKGEAWREFASTTPSISRLVEALDAERLSVATACGIRLPSFVEYCNASFETSLDGYQAIAEAVAATRNGGPLGPTSLNTRHLTEDLPYGLAVYARLGRRANVETPITDAVLAALSSACGRAFDQENLMMDAVDLAFSSRRSDRGGHFATDARKS